MKAPSLDLLKVLITVAESRNFREAAETLQISQPGVSLKLKELEAGQPLPIFTLEGKRKVLTHYGRSLYELAKDGASTLERRIENLHRMYSSPELLTVRIGGRNEVLQHMAPFFDFGGKIEYLAVSSREAADKLLRHEIDVAITYIRPDSAELQAKRIFQSKTHFVVHQDLLKRKKLTRAITEDHQFLLGTPAVAYTREGHLLRDFTRHQKLEYQALKIRHTAEDWRILLALVEQGAGYSVLPAYVQSRNPEVQSLEIPESILAPLDFYAVFESGLKKIEAFKELLAFRRLPKE